MQQSHHKQEEEQKKEERKNIDNILENISIDYGVRELEILSRKKISNCRYMMTQVREMVKMKRYEIILE